MECCPTDKCGIGKKVIPNPMNKSQAQLVAFVQKLWMIRISIEQPWTDSIFVDHALFFILAGFIVVILFPFMLLLYKGIEHFAFTNLYTWYHLMLSIRLPTYANKKPCGKDVYETSLSVTCTKWNMCPSRTILIDFFHLKVQVRFQTSTETTPITSRGSLDTWPVWPLSKTNHEFGHRCRQLDDSVWHNICTYIMGIPLNLP